jgi:hypothetical protein
LFSLLFGKFFCPFNVGLLGGFVSGAQQNYDFRPGIVKVNPVAGAIMDRHFGQSVAYRTAIAGIALPEPVYSAVYMGFSDRIFQIFHVLSENVRLLYLFHSSNVIYSLQTVKGFFKEIFDCLRGYFLPFLAGLAGTSDFAAGASVFFRRAAHTDSFYFFGGDGGGAGGIGVGAGIGFPPPEFFWYPRPAALNYKILCDEQEQTYFPGPG